MTQVNIGNRSYNREALEMLKTMQAAIDSGEERSFGRSRLDTRLLYYLDSKGLIVGGARR